MADLAESVARRFTVLRPYLTEFQRRLWLGAEATELGSDGVALTAAFESLIEPVALGGPMSPLRWTSKSIRKLTAELRAGGHLVSDSVVRRLLAEQGYSLQANVKTAEGGQHPDRDQQFVYLNEQARQHMAARDAVISVDAKKKELVGADKNAGRDRCPRSPPGGSTSAAGCTQTLPDY